MLKEFKEFALKGNVMDLAIGVIIGAAFGKIIASMVADIIMPIVGAIFGGLNFSNYFTVLAGNVTATSLVEAKKQGAILAWGNFVTVAVDFIIIAFILFLVVRAINSMKRKEEEKPADPPANEVLLAEIRDLLANKS